MTIIVNSIPLLKYFGSVFFAAERVALKPTTADMPATEAKKAPAEIKVLLKIMKLASNCSYF